MTSGTFRRLALTGAVALSVAGAGSVAATSGGTTPSATATLVSATTTARHRRCFTPIVRCSRVRCARLHPGAAPDRGRGAWEATR